EQLKDQIRQFKLADIVAESQPLGSLMAGDSGPAPWMSRKDVLSPKQIRQIGHRAERRKMHQRLGHPDEWAEE
ncbi:MAG: RtcB family protein, partial [Verrucomicrobiales bacterium]